MVFKEIKEKIHYQIQYYDRTSIAWRFDKHNYETLEDAKKNAKESKAHRFVKVTMPQNDIEILKTVIKK